MDNSRLIRERPILPKPLLLKDYLLDDLSSCSSNGFKSLPRRQQCCTNVRLIHEFDHKNNQHQKKKFSNFNKAPSKSALTAFQSVITAVKRLPFSSSSAAAAAAAAKSPEKKMSKDVSFLPRTFSKNILKKSSFWKRKPEKKEIGRWKSFDQLLKEDPEPSDRSHISTENKSNSWTGSHFTVSTGGNSNSEVNLNLQVRKNDVVEVPDKVVSGDKRMGVTNDDVSIESTASSDGTNSSTKRLSPVSVLDCPFDDEDEVSSPFQHRLARMEGTKKKLMKKIQRFENLAKLEPVNLAKQLASQPDSDNESTTAHSSASIADKFDTEKEQQDEAQQKALELLRQMKATLPSSSSYGVKLKAEKLLLDFFRERINNVECCATNQEKLLEKAEEWINGPKPGEAVVENRQDYVEEMERGEQWRTLGQENEQLALELEIEVFGALLNELLMDMISI